MVEHTTWPPSRVYVKLIAELYASLSIKKLSPTGSGSFRVRESVIDPYVTDISKNAYPHWLSVGVQEKIVFAVPLKDTDNPSTNLFIYRVDAVVKLLKLFWRFIKLEFDDLFWFNKYPWYALNTSPSVYEDAVKLFRTYGTMTKSSAVLFLIFVVLSVRK